jgi:hypothetical protein
VLAATTGVVLGRGDDVVARAMDGDAVVLRGHLVLNGADTSVEPPQPREQTG